MIGPMPNDLKLRASNEMFDVLFNKRSLSLKMQNAKISHAQCKKLVEYFDTSNVEHKLLFDLVFKCLQYEEKHRINAKQMIEHEYFLFIEDQIEICDHLQQILKMGGKQNINDNVVNVESVDCNGNGSSVMCGLNENNNSSIMENINVKMNTILRHT